MTNHEAPSTPEVIYTFVRTYIEQEGVAPNLREISAACFIARSTVVYHLTQLELQGRLKRLPGRARGIVLLEGEGEKI
jgi:SOS-response transcriptional repressor LexA